MQGQVAQIAQLAENAGPGCYFPKCATCGNCKARLLFSKLRNLRKMQGQVAISQIAQLAENGSPGSWFPKCTTCSIARPCCYFSDCTTCGNCKTRLLFLKLRNLRKLQDQVATSQIVQLAEMLVLHLAKIHKMQYKVYQIVICKKSNCMEGKCWPYLLVQYPVCGKKDRLAISKVGDHVSYRFRLLLLCTSLLLDKFVYKPLA